MTNIKILELLERAYEAGCFREVLKMIRANSSEVLIEKIIKKSKERSDTFNFDFDDLFGAD